MRHANRSTTPPITPDCPIALRGEISVRVRYAECDPMGVAHHGSYVAWLEEARTEILRAAGVSYADMESHGVFLVVSKLAMAYKAPAFYDDLLTISAEVVAGGRARIDHAYEITLAQASRPTVNGPRPTLLATGTTTLACVDPTGRPIPLPD
jgi:acyl-CoA thioester hydrolase